MSFRNDHDAAISRIAALEQELAVARDAAREKSQHDADRIAMLQREIDDLRRHEPPTPRRARPPSTPPSPVRAAPLPPIDELATRGPRITVGQLFGVFVLTAVIVILAFRLLA